MQLSVKDSSHKPTINETQATDYIAILNLSLYLYIWAVSILYN